VWSSRTIFTTLDAEDGRVLLPVDPADDGAPERSTEEYVVRPTRGSLLVAPGPPRSVVGPPFVDQTHVNAFTIADGTTPYQVTAVPQEYIDGLDRSGSGPDRAAETFLMADPTTTRRTAPAYLLGLVAALTSVALLAAGSATATW